MLDDGSAALLTAAAAAAADGPDDAHTPDRPRPPATPRLLGIDSGVACERFMSLGAWTLLTGPLPPRARLRFRSLGLGLGVGSLSDQTSEVGLGDVFSDGLASECVRPSLSLRVSVGSVFVWGGRLCVLVFGLTRPYQIHI